MGARDLKMIDEFDAKETKENLFMIAKLYGQTYLDGSFQRWGGVDRGSGWSLDQTKNYLTNLLRGKTYNSIILADVKACLKYACDKNDKESVLYFETISRNGKDHVSIDGNNTGSSIDAFIDGKEGVTIHHESAEMYLEDFSESSQQDIMYCEKVRVVILREIGIVDMCNLFRDLNTSTQLNGQEHRQARWSPMSKFIREISNGENGSIFLKLGGVKNEAEMDQRVHEEMIAQLAYKVVKNYATGHIRKNALDDFYNDKFELEQEVEKTVTNIIESVRKMANCFEKPISKKLTKGQLQNLFDVVQISQEECKIDILNHEAFFKWFLEKDNEFVTESKKVTEEDLEEKSYSYWTKYYTTSARWINIRTLFKSALIEGLDKLKEDKTVKFRRTSKDNFSWEDKSQLLKEQNSLTREGDMIDILDLYLGKLHADHMVSVKDGGKTEKRNGELMFSETNLKKGSNSNEPHFPHQMPEVATTVNE